MSGFETPGGMLHRPLNIAGVSWSTRGLLERDNKQDVEMTSSVAHRTIQAPHLRSVAHYVSNNAAGSIPQVSSVVPATNHALYDYAVNLENGSVSCLCSVTCCRVGSKPHPVVRAWHSLYSFLYFYVFIAWNCRRPRSSSVVQQCVAVFPGSPIPQLQRLKLQAQAGKGPEQFSRHLLYLYTAFLSSSDVLLLYRTSSAGLSESECRERSAEDGPNVISSSSQKLHPVFQYLQQLRVPFNVLLLSLSLVIYVTGDMVGGSIVLGMVALSSILTFWQEYRSNSAVEKLRSLVTSTVTVTRKTASEGTVTLNLYHGQGDGVLNPHIPSTSEPAASSTRPLSAASLNADHKGVGMPRHLSRSDLSLSPSPLPPVEPLSSPSQLHKTLEPKQSGPTATAEMTAAFDIPTRELCVGDIVHLQAGSVLSADCRILQSRDLLVSQASMNGESIPVEKYALSYPAPFFDLASSQRGSSLRRTDAEDDDGGEERDVERKMNPKPDSDAAAPTPFSLFDLPNLLFMGTSIVSGTATCVVISTAQQSYFGSIADRVTGTRDRTAFDLGITQYTKLMLKFMFVMVAVVIVISGTSTGDWFAAFLFGIAVAVGLTPEMLPMIITVNLARGAQVMMRGGVIVKRLNSIQNLGAMDILCTDKTGTLTCDELHLEQHMAVSVAPLASVSRSANEVDDKEEGIVSYSTGSKTVLQYAFLNSHFQTGLRNVMDAAIVRACGAEAMDESPKGGGGDPSAWCKVDEIPFDFQRRRMSVIVQRASAVQQQNDHDCNDNDVKDSADLEVADGRSSAHVLVCKGAVEEMLSVCDYIDTAPMDALDAAPRVALTTGIKSSIQEHCDKLNAGGLRVLLLALRHLPARDHHVYTVADESQLALCGVLAFADPPKESTAQALRRLSDQRIAVKVLSGDNAAVCRHVCQSVGLECATMLSGHEVSAMSDAELRVQVERTQVFAKLTPMDKERIVRTLNGLGHVVGFLGDGINDAAALRASDVGISVDNAVDIAKEAADLILLQKDLTILSEGVRAGRTVFGNIIKYIKMGASSNFGNVFSITGSSLWLSFEPMNYLQLLTQNLLYDFSQIGIPFDVVDEEYLACPRRWEIGDIAKFMIFIGPISSIFDYCTFSLAWFYFGVGADQSDTNITLFQSVWFVEGLLTQTLIVHIIRTREVPFVTKAGRAAWPLATTTSVVMIVGLALPHAGAFLADALPLVPPPAMFYPFLVLFLLSYCILTHIVKTWYYKTFGYK